MDGEGENADEVMQASSQSSDDSDNPGVVTQIMSDNFREILTRGEQYPQNIEFNLL